jgi:hypothetical protein
LALRIALAAVPKWHRTEELLVQINQQALFFNR